MPTGTVPPRENDDDDDWEDEGEWQDDDAPNDAPDCISGRNG